VQSPDRISESAVRSADDDRLVAGLSTGDAVAFEALFRRYAAALCGFADSYVRSPESAEEIVQDLFTWIWEHRHSIEMPRGARSYLFGAVRNRALNALRDRGTALAASDRLAHEASLRLPSATGGNADADLLAADLESALQSIVSAMPTRCREVFVLVRMRQLSYAEVASILGIAPKTVEIHMSRALAILRARLSPWIEG